MAGLAAPDMNEPASSPPSDNLRGNPGRDPGGPKKGGPGAGPAGERESLLSNDRCRARRPRPRGVNSPNGRDEYEGSDGLNEEGGPVGVPPSDKAREKRDEIVEDGAGLPPTGVLVRLLPRVGATSCNLKRNPNIVPEC